MLFGRPPHLEGDRLADLVLSELEQIRKDTDRNEEVLDDHEKRITRIEIRSEVKSELDVADRSARRERRSTLIKAVAAFLAALTTVLWFLIGRIDKDPEQPPASTPTQVEQTEPVPVTPPDTTRP